MRHVKAIGTVLVLPATAWLAFACSDGQGGRTPTDPALDARSAQASLSRDSDGDDNDRLSAVPFVFVGRAGECGTGYPAGSHIVTAGWLGGMGLPDNGGPNSGSNPADNPNKNDPHLGLLISKNGPTPDCSSSGARITGVRGMVVGPTFQLGFDYRNGGHCSGGAPRFNVAARAPDGSTRTFHFVGGCGNDKTPTPAPQDPQWTRVRFETTDPSESFPPIPAGSRIETISILYDEGTDTPSVQDPNGVGLAVVDNIYINGQFIRRGRGIAEGRGNRGNDGEDDNSN